MKNIRILTVHAALLVVMALPAFVIPAQGQQEVDPTVYPILESSAKPSPSAKATVERRHASLSHDQRPLKKKARKQVVASANREQANLVAKK